MFFQNPQIQLAVATHSSVLTVLRVSCTPYNVQNRHCAPFQWSGGQWTPPGVCSYAWLLQVICSKGILGGILV